MRSFSSVHFGASASLALFDLNHIAPAMELLVIIIGVESMSVSEETKTSKATAPISLTSTVAKRGPKIAVIGTAKPGRAPPKTDEGASTEGGGGRDSYAVTALADIVDRSLHAAASRFTMGLSPAALVRAPSAS